MSTVRSMDLVAAAGVTYRQLDHWARRGWIHPEGESGSGYARSWSLAECAIVAKMAALVDAGYRVEVAARIARHGIPS